VGVLACIDGSLAGELYKIHDGDNSLGREGGDVQMPSRRISRHHARIQHQDGVFVIEANAEVMDKNPTFLNEDEIDAEALSDGDTIKLGDCTFRFRTI
jgi:pSer/pThr/pTyr-binding forkhead associated (FHA) protein